MKKINYLAVGIFTIFQLGLHAQNVIPFDSLDGNNVNMRVYSDGGLASDVENRRSKFLVPKLDSTSTIFAMDLWIVGRDKVSKDTFLVENTFRQACLYTTTFNGVGPIADLYSNTYENQYKRVWKISKSEVDYHKNNAGTFNYEMIDVIKNWPAHGVASNGEAFNLAPFIDWNQDGMYTPEFGDYPCIKGDQAIYTISNIENADSCYKWSSFPIEIHQMTYSFNTSDALNNTVFIEFKIVNRGALDLEEVFVGEFIDFDIGCADDDYIGSDSTLNLFYAYNGNDFDRDCRNAKGFSSNVPFCGAVFLNQPLTSFMTYNRGADTSRGDALSAKDFDHYLRAEWKDGTHLKYGGNGHFLDTNATNKNTNYFFSADPRDSIEWNESTTGFPPFDRRGIGSTGPFNINAGHYIELAIAIVTTQDPTKNYLDVFDTFKNDVTFIQDYYDNNIHYCQNWVTSVLDNQLDENIRIYPNPAKSKLFVEVSSNESVQVALFNLLGKEINLSRMIGNSLHQIDVSNLERGFYLLQINDGKNLVNRKILLD